MQLNRNTSSADALAKARKLAEEIGLELAIERATRIADLVAAERAIEKAFELVDQIEQRDVRLLPVEKKAADQQVVFGVVLEPGSVDAHGDTISAEVIAKAAHEWLAKFQIRGLMHRSNVNAKVQIFESYLAPVDLKIGGQRVKKGTWLLMYKILDKKLWAKIRKGELTGFSMGGFGRRIKLRS
jgi:hypothetical protein